MLNDLRYALRQFAKSPDFTLVALLTLALCIGANATVYSLVSAFLFSPLPYRDVDRLVRVFHTTPQVQRTTLSIGEYETYRKESQTFEGMAAFVWAEMNLASEDQPPEFVRGLWVTGDFFEVLGVSAKLGRAFLPSVANAIQNSSVVLSHGLWTRRFGGDTNVVGRTFRLEGESVAISGVMPDTFDCPKQWGRVDIWKLVSFDAQQKQDRISRYLGVVGKLKAGSELSEAQAELSVIAGRLAREYPESNSDQNVRVEGLRESFVQPVERQICYFLTAIVGFVLLIGCVNLANLQFVQTAKRFREVAIRTALGVRRGRLQRQFLSESVLLGLLGGGLGLVLGFFGNAWLAALINAFAASMNQPAVNIPYDATISGCVIGLSVVAGVMFGMLPALQASRTDLVPALREGEPSTSASKARRRLQSILVVSEVALAIVLLAGCGLAVRAISGSLSQNLGFKTDRIMAVQIALPPMPYSDDEKRRAFYRQVIEQFGALPGVEELAASTWVPVWAPQNRRNFLIEDRQETNSGQVPSAAFASVSSEFFAVMKIPVKAGRTFNDRDRASAPPVVMINESMAKKFWPGENAVGKRILNGDTSRDPWKEIVGVVSDVVPPGNPTGTEVRSQVYETMWQVPWRYTWVLLQTGAKPETMADAARRVVASIDSDLPVYRLTTIEQAVEYQVAHWKLLVWLLSGFACLGLILAGVGIYGVVAFSVAHRTREVGIRMSLGAQRSDVLKMMFRQGMAPVWIGLGLGLAGALALARILRSFLFGISSFDPTTFVTVIVLLIGTAALACYLPARRATKVDPITALRCE